jgi:hypothetical protein
MRLEDISKVSPDREGRVASTGLGLVKVEGETG